MNKQAFLEETYNSAFEDELDKIAKEGSKTYAGRGAAIGAGYGAANLAISSKRLINKLKFAPPGKAKYIGAGLGALAGVGLTAGVGAGIGSLFKRKNK